MLADDGIKYRGKGGVTDEQARRIYREGGVVDGSFDFSAREHEAIVNYKRCPYHVKTHETLKGRRVVTVRRAG